VTDRTNLQVETLSQQELRELVQVLLQDLLTDGNLAGAKTMLGRLQPADVAEAIEELPELMQAIAFRLLPKDEAIEVYEYLSPGLQQLLIEDFKRRDVLDIVEKMSPDDRVRLFDELPAKVVKRLLNELSADEREATAQLLGYEAGTAGRIMTPEYGSLKESDTVEQAIARIRKIAKNTETIYYLYVIDTARHLTGIVSLRDLVVAMPTEIIGDLMTRDVVFVQTDTDQEDVAYTIKRYDFLAVPVVDREQRLVGIITVDDVIDILEEETTEDIYKMAAVQTGADNYFQSSLLSVARRRVLWLLVLLFTNTGTAAVIHTQSDILQKVVALSSFIPLLIGTGGNVGAQSSTVVIRSLNVDQAKTQKPFWVIQREARVGLLLGLMLGAIVVIWAYLLQGNMPVAIAVGFSLIAISTLASFAGASLPFLFRAFGFDPALMSAPFITTAVDVAGVMIYFAIARLILKLW
jgi:magnesium transporter